MKTISLRVDVDTLEGSLKGIPALLRMLDKVGMQASFYFSLGPDSSGKALRRIFRKGFLAKQLRNKAGSYYSLKTMMYGVLLPAPVIGKRAAAEMRLAKAAGHEVAIHAWDHVQYHDLLDRKSRAWLEAWFRDAHAGFEDVFGEKARGAVSPAWRCNDHTLEIQEAYGLDYAGDCRGTRAFYPVVRGRTLATLQVPTTLPTLDELRGLDGLTPDEVNAKVLGLVREDALNVYALHTEVEGGALAETFVKFLQGLKDREVVARTHADWVPDLKAANPPAAEIGRMEIPGRSGWVSVGL
ncbi:polysaccharide deacetylase family protein [Mesoterricola sediminis]|uniref:4-deoxy-4-formamido-L-arabinose-phosphoundecapren ol deformylase n=1 Tax=Mesoterricola sediminis TaxID=2927980 RepID=A0AA48KCN7_9BACT|nr:polysaccharide deacetylase family protein [Mesoterricola sediminis]BDU77286.1 4-deoxy-4-formamido-L-arabinose-phosphoundecapren ol deformylase [Mesoterricola sediminis]